MNDKIEKNIHEYAELIEEKELFVEVLKIVGAADYTEPEHEKLSPFVYPH
jgi:hypothetical protein